MLYSQLAQMPMVGAFDMKAVRKAKVWTEVPQQHDPDLDRILLGLS